MTAKYQVSQNGDGVGSLPEDGWGGGMTHEGWEAGITCGWGGGKAQPVKCVGGQV